MIRVIPILLVSDSPRVELTDVEQLVFGTHVVPLPFLSLMGWERKGNDSHFLRRDAYGLRIATAFPASLRRFSWGRGLRATTPRRGIVSTTPPAPMVTRRSRVRFRTTMVLPLPRVALAFSFAFGRISSRGTPAAGSGPRVRLSSWHRLRTSWVAVRIGRAWVSNQATKTRGRVATTRQRSRLCS